MPESRWVSLFLLLVLLAGLGKALPGQQTEGRDGASGFDANQWNGAIRGSASPPRFDPGPSRAVLLPWAEPAARPTAAQRALGGLALVATGSTLRSGPHRLAVKELILGLRTVDFAVLPCGERILATLALQEVATASNYQLLSGFADQQTWGLRQQLATQAPLALPAMDLLLLHRLARCQSGRNGWAEIAASLRVLAHAAVCSDRLGSHRRTDAAWLLVRRWRGEAVPDDLLLAVCWPANLLADPQHTWIGIVAAGEVAAAARASLLPQLDRLIAARHPAAAEHAGSWEPGPGGDRAETTAWHLWTLQIANRLLAADVQAAAAAPPRR